METFDKPRLAWRPTLVHKCFDCPWRSHSSRKGRCDLEKRTLPKVDLKRWTRVFNENINNENYAGEWGFPKWCPLLSTEAFPQELYDYFLDSHYFTKVPDETPPLSPA